MNNLSFYNKFISLPDELKLEVEDFIDFLSLKKELKSSGVKPQFGSGKGMFIMKPDFDEPLDDFNEYMR